MHGLHLGAELQLGQRLSQDLEPPHHVEHVHELHDYPHHELGVVLLEPEHLLGVGPSVLLLVAGAVVVSSRLVHLVTGLHLGAELQLGQRRPQDLDLPRHAGLVHDLKLSLLLA